MVFLVGSVGGIFLIWKKLLVDVEDILIRERLLVYWVILENFMGEVF